MWYQQRLEEWMKKTADGTSSEEAHVYLGLPETCYEELQQGVYTYLVGSDEVGWGALAGPLVVVAVRAPLGWTCRGLKDSKEFKGKNRHMQMEDVYVRLMAAAQRKEISYSIVQVDVPNFEEMGAATALRKAHCAALEAQGARRRDTLAFVDGDVDLPFTCGHLPKADSFIPQVMAASIMGKYLRDNFMMDAAEQYPAYGFGSNMGYGSEVHRAALLQHGPCPLHRQSYLREEWRTHETPE